MAVPCSMKARQALSLAEGLRAGAEAADRFSEALFTLHQTDGVHHRTSSSSGVAWVERGRAR
jgi:hypothetical protein